MRYDAGEAERASGLIAEHIFQGRDRLLGSPEPAQDDGSGRRSGDGGPGSQTASPDESSDTNSGSGLRGQAYTQSRSHRDSAIHSQTTPFTDHLDPPSHGRSSPNRRDPRRDNNSAGKRTG